MIDIALIYAYMILMERYIVSPQGLYDSLGPVVAILFIAIPAYCYHLLCEVFLNGQSLGKKVLGIKVMDISGKQPTLSQYLIRWSFRLFDMMITLGAGAVLSAALTKHSQRIGDILAGTVVIDQRAKTNLYDTIYLEIEDHTYQPMFTEVMRLSDRDINGIRNLLDTPGSSRDTELYMTQVGERIRQVLKIDTELEPRKFLEQLLRDYNFLTRK